MPLLGPVLGSPVLSLWGTGAAPPVPGVSGTFPPAAPVPRGYPHVTLWTDLACRGGLPVRRLAALTDGWGERHQIDGHLVTHQFTGAVPTRWEGSADLVEGMVLRVVRTPGDIREYILTDLTDGLQTGGLTALTAAGPESLLATMGRLPASLGGGAPADVIARILTHAEAWLTLGTVTPILPLDVAEGPVYGSSVGAGLLRTVEAVERRTTVAYEVVLTRPDEVSYQVHLVILGSGAPITDLPYGTALRTISRHRTLTTRMSRAFDPDAGMANSYWVIDAVDAGASPNPTVDLSALDPGVGLAIEDGQWAGAWLEDVNGVRHEILDTQLLSPEVTRCELDDATGLVVGQLVKLVADSAGAAVTEAVLPSADAALPRPITRPISSGAGPLTNFCPNPTLATWDALIPRGWAVPTDSTYPPPTPIPGDIIRSTVPGTFETGGASAVLMEDESRRLSWRQTVFVPEGGAGYFIQYWARIRIDAVNLQDPTGAAAHIGVLVSTGFDGLGVPQVHFTAVDQPIGEWVIFTASIPLPVPAVGQVGTREIGMDFMNWAMIPQTFPFSDLTNRSRLVIDAAMGLVHPTMPEFLAGSGPARAIQRANLDFLAYGPPQVRLEVQPIDLARLDPLGAGHYRTLRLGAQARVIADPLGTRTTVRVLEYEEPGTRMAPGLTLSTRPRLLSRALARSL